MDFLDSLVLPGLGALMVVLFVAVNIAIKRYDRRFPDGEDD